MRRNGQLGGRGSAQAGYVMGIIGTVLLGSGCSSSSFWLIIVVRQHVEHVGAD